jgi:hypothetical protein
VEENIQEFIVSFPLEQVINIIALVSGVIGFILGSISTNLIRLIKALTERAMPKGNPMGYYKTPAAKSGVKKAKKKSKK